MKMRKSLSVARSMKRQYRPAGDKHALEPGKPAKTVLKRRDRPRKKP